VAELLGLPLARTVKSIVLAVDNEDRPRRKSGCCCCAATTS
jgi:hypothetical protein